MLTLSTRPARWLNVVLIITLLVSLLPPPPQVSASTAGYHPTEQDPNKQSVVAFPPVKSNNLIPTIVKTANEAVSSASAISAAQVQGQVITRTWGFESGTQGWMPLDFSGYGLPFWEAIPPQGPGVGVWRAPSNTNTTNSDVYIWYPHLISLDQVTVNFYNPTLGFNIGGVYFEVYTSTDTINWVFAPEQSHSYSADTAVLNLNINNRYVMVHGWFNSFWGNVYGHLDKLTFRNCVGCLADSLPPDQTWTKISCPFCASTEQQHYAADPINTFSGNYNYQTTDLAHAAVGQPLSFERSYNSLPVTGTVVYSQPLGYGWTHNYDLNLTFPGDPGGEASTVILKAPHGSRMRFTDNGDGTYTPYPGVWAEMTRQGTTPPYTYVITAANQTAYTFVDASSYAPALITFTAKITPTDEPYSASYGSSVALSGNTAIMGAPYDDLGT